MLWRMLFILLQMSRHYCDIYSTYDTPASVLIYCVMSGCSPASDLWAIGCILYQMVSGMPPFQSGLILFYSHVYRAFTHTRVSSWVIPPLPAPDIKWCQQFEGKYKNGMIKIRTKYISPNTILPPPPQKIIVIPPPARFQIYASWCTLF